MATPLDSTVKIKTLDAQRWCALTLAPLEGQNGCPQRHPIVEGSYAILQSLKSEEKRNIEMAWELVPGQLEQDSPQTSIPLCHDWRTSYESGDLCILPHHDVLVKIFLRLNKYQQPQGSRSGRAVVEPSDLNLGLHRYKFIPVGKRSNTVPLVRHRFEPGKEYQELVPDVCDVYRPPNFDGYQEIHSLAHPYAVMWKAVEDFGNTNQDDFGSDRHWEMMLTAINIVQRWNAIIRKTDYAQVRARLPPQPDAEGDSSDHLGPPGSSSSTDDSLASPSAGGEPGVGCSNSAQPSYGRFARIPSEVSYTNNRRSLRFSSSGSPSTEAEFVSEDDQSEEDSEDEDNRPAALAPYEPQDVEKWATDSRSVDVGGLNDSFTDSLSPSTEPSSLPVDYDEEPAEVPHGDWEGNPISPNG